MLVVPGIAFGADSISPPTTLPLSKVVLYSSGVGYFQHDGTVQGNTHIDLRFKAEAVNDLLKSLVVQDFGGGHVSAVTFESRDPITKTLQSFGVNLTNNPTLGQLLDQIRGERIEAAAPTSVTGMIVGVERKEQAVGPGNPPAVVQMEYLNLLTDDGLRSLPLSQVQRIRLLNERLNGELQQALTVLSTGHDTQRKTVALLFSGQGSRQARVAYLIETPIWKTSYRLVLTDEGPPLLQGWAIVENTTDQDWNGVRLSLVSGRPISFIMDLYQPLYARRPVVEPELYAALRPPVYAEAMEKQAAASTGPSSQEPRRALGRAMSKVEAGGPGQESAMFHMQGAAPAAPSPSDLDLTQGVGGGAKGLETGELFQYTIEAPVMLSRQTSAMLPILTQKVEGQKVSIYNPAVHGKYPLNGYRLKNTTSLHLMQGPITVFDGGAYAGDGRIEDIAPGQDRLIGYALDLKSEVETLIDPSQQTLVSVSIRKGILLATRKAIEARTYQVRNRDQKGKTVLIEHPFRAEWSLKEPAGTVERSRDSYRFPVRVEAGQASALRVREERMLQQTIALSDSTADQIGYLLQGSQMSPGIRDALQKAVMLRDRNAQTAAQRGRLEQRSRDIAQEQGRIRENLGKIPQNAELYGRYLKKLDQQETEMERLQKELESLRHLEDAQRRELNDYLLSLNIE